jgi:hypothetical protein
MLRKDVPVLDAKVHPLGGQLVVWCTYCKRNHFHGIASANGHAWAHCYKATPYSATGYFLRMAQDEASRDK